MADWKRKIEGFLRDTMRYCFGTAEGSLIETEFSGEEGTMGFKDHLFSMIQDERRKAYRAGYLQAGSDLVSDIEGLVSNGSGPVVFSPETNQITADRRFGEWDQ